MDISPLCPTYTLNSVFGLFFAIMKLYLLIVMLCLQLWIEASGNTQSAASEKKDPDFFAEHSQVSLFPHVLVLAVILPSQV